MSNRPSLCWKCVHREYCTSYNKDPEPDIEKVLKAITLCGLGDPVFADKEEISFSQWLFCGFGMTVEQFESSTTAYGKKFFHSQYLKYLSKRNAITTGKATGVEE